MMKRNYIRPSFFYIISSQCVGEHNISVLDYFYGELFIVIVVLCHKFDLFCFDYFFDATKSTTCKMVYCLGMRPARGLWGIRHTRKPVDIMVQEARSLPSDTVLPMLKITISTKGINLDFMSFNKNAKQQNVFHSIDTISYGVQDMIYTRVFSMIIVKVIFIILFNLLNSTFCFFFH